MPLKRPGSPLAAGQPDAKRQIQSEDVDPKLPLAITIASVDSDTPLRHLPPVVSNGSNIRPLKIRPIPVSNNRALLTKYQWKTGAPWPRGSKREFFKVSRRFRRPKITGLPNLGHHLQQHHAKRNSRLDGVTFFSPGDLESAWVAGLVGFDDTHQLNTWLDRDVARVAYDFVRLLDGQALPTLPGVVTAVSNLRTTHHPLFAELNAKPGVVVGDSGVVPVQELGSIARHGHDTTLSYIAVLYRILTSFPQRFPEEKDQPRKMWGFTHNNWQAAVCVFRAFRKRRGSSMKPDSSPSERINLDAVWYGTIAEQRLLRLGDTNSSAAEARNAVGDTSVANPRQGHGSGGVARVKVEDGDDEVSTTATLTSTDVSTVATTSTTAGGTTLSTSTTSAAETTTTAVETTTNDTHGRAATQGSNGGGVSAGFKIAMVGSVVTDPQEAPIASSAAQGSSRGSWFWSCFRRG